jgi:hypothetical protein
MRIAGIPATQRAGLISAFDRTDDLPTELPSLLLPAIASETKSADPKPSRFRWQTGERSPTPTRHRTVLLPGSSYLLASYCHAPILKTLSGSTLFLSVRSLFMVSCGNTSSISASLSGMALFK